MRERKWLKIKRKAYEKSVPGKGEWKEGGETRNSEETAKIGRNERVGCNIWFVGRIYIEKEMVVNSNQHKELSSWLSRLQWRRWLMFSDFIIKERLLVCVFS